jgi:hypothetical protein
MGVGKQRHYHTNNSILKDRKDRLDQLGFVWRVQRTNDNCFMPYSHEEEDTCTTLDMGGDRKEVMEELGCASKAPRCNKNNDKIWHTQYEKLVEFKRKNGNCLVPTKYKQDKSLGLWVCKQRTRHTTKTMRLDRKELLDELGFAWSLLS